MPRFAYKGVSLSGDSREGVVEAADRAAALRQLEQQGAYVTQIDSAESGPALGRRSIGTARLAGIYRQLAATLHAGLPLLTALRVISEQTEHLYSRSVLESVCKEVNDGRSLSEAMADRPNVFEPMHVSLVQVGETGGMLETIAAQLADVCERRTRLRRRIQSALFYPALVVLVGIISVVIIVGFIVPNIVESLGTQPEALPLPTRMLMASSAMIRVQGWWMVLAAIGAASAWRAWVASPGGRLAWDRAKLQIPLFGRLVQKLAVARFARSLGALAEGGIAITEALAVVRNTLGNAVLAGRVDELIHSLHAGEAIAPVLRQIGGFPPLLVQMVGVGEQSGKLGEMLLRAADVHDEEANTAIDRFVTVFPVALILVLAVLVAFIMAGVLLPIIGMELVAP